MLKPDTLARVSSMLGGLPPSMAAVLLTTYLAAVRAEAELPSALLAMPVRGAADIARRHAQAQALTASLEAAGLACPPPLDELRRLFAAAVGRLDDPPIARRAPIDAQAGARRGAAQTPTC